MKDLIFPVGKGTYISVADKANREESDMLSISSLLRNFVGHKTTGMGKVYGAI
jgi:hypothetical protein